MIGTTTPLSGCHDLYDPHGLGHGRSDAAPPLIGPDQSCNSRTSMLLPKPKLALSIGACGKIWILSGAPTPVMENGDARHVHDRASSVPEAKTEVDVLEAVKVVFVEESDGVEDTSANQHDAAADRADERLGSGFESSALNMSHPSRHGTVRDSRRLHARRIGARP